MGSAEGIHPSAGGAPPIFKVPQEWGIQGVDKSVSKRSLAHYVLRQI